MPDLIRIRVKVLDRISAAPSEVSLNVFPALKDGDFRLVEADAPARSKDV